jgi:aryl-alcohol dehydrogenase-like predicted oxidoreductase
MRMISLASGAIETSRLGFGTSSLHHLPTRRARQRLLGRGFDRGLRYFDTAPLYGNEIAEREIGRFAAGRRAALTIATKFGLAPDPWLAAMPWLSLPLGALRVLRRRLRPSARPGAHRSDYRPAVAVERLHRSLVNLRTDYVDVLYLHEPALELIADPDGLLRALERFKSEGKARLVGLSGSAADCVRIAVSIPALGEVLQVAAGPASDGAATVRAAGFRADVTFGHFRAHVTPAAPGDRAALLRTQLVAAAGDNPDGVILFSSRRAGRIDEVAGELESIDGAR